MIEREFSDYVTRLNKALLSVNSDSVIDSLTLIQKISDDCGRIWIIGNGGSALTASHFATDLNRCSTKSGNPIRAMSLCDNIGLLTAISNDFTFTEVFLKQLEKLYIKGDLLITISASGNSKNIIQCLEFGRENEVKSIAITGFDGGAARELCDVSIHVPTSIGDYGVAEDAHSVLMHFLCWHMRKQ